MTDKPLAPLVQQYAEAVTDSAIAYGDLLAFIASHPDQHGAFCALRSYDKARNKRETVLLNGLDDAYFPPKKEPTK